MWKRLSRSRTEEETRLTVLKKNLLYDNSACVSFSLTPLKADPCPPNVRTAHVKNPSMLNEPSEIDKRIPSLPSDILLRCQKHVN